jgi:type IV secretion system protein VirB10
MTRPPASPDNGDTPPAGDRAALTDDTTGARRLNLTRVLAVCVVGAFIAAVLILPTLRGRKAADEAQAAEKLRVAQTVGMQNRTPPTPPAPAAPETPPSDKPAGQAAADTTGADRSSASEKDPDDKMLEASRRAPVLVFKSNAGPGSSPPAEPVTPPVRTATVAPPDPDRGLGRLLDTTTIGRARAVQLGDLNLLLTAGTIVPCILDTAIDTTNPGFVSCHTEHDILSANGLVVLLDRGTKVLGEYRQGLRQGQERIFVVWNRAVTADGVAIDLGSPAADALGRAGFDGQVETYFWTRFGATMLLSVISDAVSYGRDQVRNGNSGGGDTGDASTGSVNTAAADALDNSINIAPVLRKNQGEAVSIFVARDLDFSGVYRLRTSMGQQP